MRKPKYLIWVLWAETVGILSGFLTRQGMMQYEETVVKPMLTPPGWLFPVVWTVLYALMGIGGARISMAPDTRVKKQGLNLYVAQLTVNFFWSLIFFNAGAYGFALVWLILLWVLAAWMTLLFRRVDTFAAGIQIPYLLWLTFAAYLNYGVWRLNR